MTRHTTSRSLRLLGASVIVVAAAMFSTSIGALAASAPGGTGAVTTGCSTTASGGTCTFTFSFKTASGAADCGDTVNFSVTGIATASMNPTQGTTDCNTGNVLSVFSAGSGCGTATITATAVNTGATVQTTDTVACAAVATLPNTSTLPPSNSAWWLALLALAVLVLAGGGVALRRVRATS